VGANLVANVDVWALTQKAAVKDTTAFGASGAWQANTMTLKNWTAKVDGRVDPSDTLGQLVLLNGLGTTVALKLSVDGTHFWSGNAIITAADPKSNVNDVATISYSFTGTGACTLT
jgi:predicted secreted protein